MTYHCTLCLDRQQANQKGECSQKENKHLLARRGFNLSQVCASMKAASIPSIVEPTELPLVANQLDPAIVVWLGRRAYRNILPQQCLESPVKEMDKTVLVVTAGGGAGKIVLRSSIGFIEADVVLAERAVECRFRDGPSSLGRYGGQGIQVTLPKTKMGSEKKWVFSCWEARSFRDNQSSQAVDPGRCPLAHCRQKRLRFHGRDGGLPTHGVSCRANARCLMWTRFDGLVYTR